ncbi:SIR2 family protein [bacterium]|nr:SIR2 family protein [candidate division CSSED10-310 bacterium]
MNCKKTRISDSLKDLAPRRVALLFGAGVSYPSPTSLPLANAFLSTIWEALVIGLKATWENIPIPVKPDSWPQFELLLDELSSVRRGLVSRLLQPYKHIAPNKNHEILAYLGELGCSLITTNFDANVEEVLRNRGTSTAAIASINDCRKFDKFSNRVRLLKLHGCINSPNTIVCSYSDLTRRGRSPSPTGLSIPRYSALMKALENRMCFVLGYSGSDKLDIIPALKALPGKQIVWIQHSSEECTLQDVEAHIRRLSKKTKNNSWYDITFSADTTKFLELLLSCIDSNANVHDPIDSPIPDVRESILATCKCLSGDEILFALTRILFCSGNIQQSLNFLDHASGYEIPSRVRFTIEENLIRFRYTDREKITALKKLQSRLVPPVPTWVVSRINLDIADIHDSLGEYRKAQNASSHAIKFAEKSGDQTLVLDAKVLHAIILGRLGKNKKSIELYLSLIPSLKRQGRGRDLAEVYHNLGCQYAIRNDYDIALYCFKQAQRCWKFCGDEAQYLCSQLNQANCLFHTECINDARCLLNKVLKIVSQRDGLMSVRIQALILKGHDLCIRLVNWDEGLAILRKCTSIMLELPEAIHQLPNYIETIQRMISYLESGGTELGAVRNRYILSLRQNLSNLGFQGMDRVMHVSE